MTKESYDLRIYYNASSYVSGRCSRWDCSNYAIVIETWLKKADLNNLVDNIRPGATRELKRIIYSPKFYDGTWQGLNTLKLRPVAGTSLYEQRGSEKIIYPKNINSSPLNGASGWLEVKIEGYISGNSL